MHYVGAQIAYLEYDPVRTAAQLNAIKLAVFNPDADWRIRGMREYAEVRGNEGRQAPTSPGLGFLSHWTGLLSAFFWWCASGHAWRGIVGALGRWQIQRRLARIRKLNDELRSMWSPSLA